MKRRDLWLPVLLLLGAIILAMPPMERRAHAVHGNDGFLNYAYLMSLLTDGDISFADDALAYDNLGRDYPFAVADTPIDETTGLMVNRYGWGSALLWAPFVAPLHLVGGEPEGLTTAQFLGVRLGTALWGALGLIALMAVARRRLSSGGDRPVLLAAFALLGATNLGFYLLLHPSMSTGPAFALAAFAIWLLDAIATDRRPGHFFALGVVMALLFATRFGDVGFLVGLLPAVLVANWEGKRANSSQQTLPIMVPGFIAGALPVAAVQMLIWYKIYGSALSGPTPYLGGEYAFAFPGRWGAQVLFSGNHGWLLWHPMVLIGLIGLGLIAADRKMPLWLRLTPLAVVAQWLLVSAWPVWDGGASFGGRLMATTLAVVFLGLVRSAQRWGRGFFAALIVLTAWNALLTVEYGLGLISREGPVSLGDILQGAGKLFGLS